MSPFVTHPSSPILSFCQSLSLYCAFLYDLSLCFYCTSFHLICMNRQLLRHSLFVWLIVLLQTNPRRMCSHFLFLLLSPPTSLSIHISFQHTSAIMSDARRSSAECLAASRKIAVPPGPCILRQLQFLPEQIF